MPPPPSVQNRRSGGPRVRISPLGDTALLAELGSRLDTALNTRAIALAAALRKRRDVRQAVAGYASVTVHFDPDQATVDSLGAAIKRLAATRPKVEVPGRLHRIPVVYDGEDLEDVTRSLNFSRNEIIAMDRFAHAAANLLVGNDRNQATLECTLSGPGLLALRPCLVAITGADLRAEVNGRAAPLWNGIFMAAGDRLSFAGRRTGMRAYV